MALSSSKLSPASEWLSCSSKEGQCHSLGRGDGHISRFRKETSYLPVQAQAFARPLAEACNELGVDLPGGEAMFLWNAFFDPRETVDLVDTVELGEEPAARRVFAAVCGANLAGPSPLHLCLSSEGSSCREIIRTGAVACPASGAGDRQATAERTGDCSGEQSSNLPGGQAFRFM